MLQRLFGYHLYLYLFARYMVNRLPHDRHERDFMHLLTYVNERDAVIDVGANIGVMTYYLARKANSGRVFAIEPIPSNRRIVERLMRRFRLRNVELMAFSVGETTGSSRMIIPRKQGVHFHGLAHVVKKGESVAGEMVDVPMKRLDDVSELEGYKITAIKLDVEESEYAALIGAKELLVTQKPVVYCELWNTKNRRLAFDFMQSVGYAAWVYNGIQLEAAEITTPKQNFFFLPKT